METKVLRSAIETYPIIILILTQKIQRLLATKPECSFMFVTVLSETRSSVSSVWKPPSFCLFMNIFRTQRKERKGKELYLSSRSSAGALIGDTVN